MNFLVCYQHDQINILRRFDSKDPFFAKYQEKKARDIIVKDVPQKPVPDIEERINKLKETFEIPSYKESSAAYEKYKSEHKGKEPKKWYSMRNGPNNFYELADYLGFPAQYETLYRSWSGSVHGSDIVNEKLSIVDPGVAAFTQLRYPSTAPNVTFMAITFGLSTIRLMTAHYVPEKAEENSAWFKREIEASYKNLNKIKFIESEDQIPST
jgi:phenolic acid decarboxylase